MTWFKVDDGFHSHPKVLEAGNEAIGLFVRCGSYCAQHLTEGLVPRAIALMYGDIALVDILVKAGLFTPVSTGWLIHDFLVYNPTKEKVTTDREAAARRQREARERSKAAREEAARKAAERNSHADSHGVTNAVTHGTSHTHADAHAKAEDENRHAVTHEGADSDYEDAPIDLAKVDPIAAVHDLADELSRRDSRQQSRLPRPDPTRPVLLTEVLEEQSSSATATPAADDTSAMKPKRAGKKAAPEPRQDVEALCSRLVDRMVARGCRRPTVTDAWRDAARLLLDKDGVNFQFAMDVLDWSQRSTFWRKNILSMPKFREKWDTLWQQAEEECGPHPRNKVQAPAQPGAAVESYADNVVQLPRQRPSTTDQRVAQAKAAGQRFAAAFRAAQANTQGAV